MKKEYLTKFAMQKTEGIEEPTVVNDGLEQLYRTGAEFRMDGKPVSYRKLTRKAARMRETGQYMMPDIYLSEKGEVIADYHRVENKS